MTKYIIYYQVSQFPDGLVLKSNTNAKRSTAAIFVTSLMLGESLRLNWILPIFITNYNNESKITGASIGLSYDF